MTNVDDIVAAKIAAAIARTVATRRRRATQQAARQAGLTARHRIKLAHLDAAEASSVPANGTGSVPTNGPTSRSPEREVTVRPNDDLDSVPANEAQPDQPSVRPNARLSVPANEEPETASVPANESYSVGAADETPDALSTTEPTTEGTTS